MSKSWLVSAKKRSSELPDTIASDSFFYRDIFFPELKKDAA
jgi:hypothetical protein